MVGCFLNEIKFPSDPVLGQILVLAPVCISNVSSSRISEFEFLCDNEDLCDKTVCSIALLVLLPAMLGLLDCGPYRLWVTPALFCL